MGGIGLVLPGEIKVGILQVQAVGSIEINAKALIRAGPQGQGVVALGTTICRDIDFWYQAKYF